jgi:hypothetical protein
MAGLTPKPTNINELVPLKTDEGTSERDLPTAFCIKTSGGGINAKTGRPRKLPTKSIQMGKCPLVNVPLSEQSGLLLRSQISASRPELMPMFDNFIS